MIEFTKFTLSLFLYEILSFAILILFLIENIKLGLFHIFLKIFKRNVTKEVAELETCVLYLLSYLQPLS